MAALVFFDQPNWQVSSLAGGGNTTTFQAVTIPTGFPTGAPGVSVTITVLTAAGTAAGGVVFITREKAATPTTGFPIQSGTTIVINTQWDLWIKFTAGTDVAYFAWNY